MRDLIPAARLQSVGDAVARDFTFALRTLRRAPVFTGVAVVTLALGIGASTAVFSVADAVLVRGLPYRDAGRLMAVYETDEGGHFRVPSFPTFDDWNAQRASGASAIDGLAFVRGNGFSLPGVDGPEQHAAAYVTPGFFSMMGTQVMIGRTFVTDEESPGASAVAVLSYDFFIQRYGGDVGVLGRVLDVDSVPTTIVGVMPRGFAFPNFAGPTWLPPALWMPIGVYQARNTALRLRGLHVDSRAIVRLAAGADSARGVAALRVIESRLERMYPEQAHWTSVALQPISDELFGNVRPGLVLLAVAILLVLLLACANVTNILLARGSARARELAVRTALGAGRWRIARQLLTETGVLATVAGALGVLLAIAFVGVVRHAAGDRLPFASQIVVDTPVALFAAAVTLGVAAVVGILPALRASGGGVMEQMRGGATAAVGSIGARRLRGSLVAVQFAFALTLLVGAGLLLQSFRRLEAVPLGYDATDVISFTIAAPTPKYADPAQAAALYGEIMTATRAIPTVSSSAAAGGALLSVGVVTEDWPADRPGPQALYHPVSTEYLQTLRVPLIAGRWFSDDDMRSPVGLVVNEKLAKALSPSGQVIGRRITVHRSSQARADFGQPITMPVIGVVADIHESGRATKPDPEVFLPYTLEVWPWMNFVVRAPNAARVVPAVTRAVHDVDPSIQFRGKPSVEERSFAGLVAPPFLTMVISGFAACALLIAAVGLYGIVAYGVAQRTREVGIRLALGAPERSVVALVVREGALSVLVGASVGVFGALASSRLLTALLFDTKASDVPTFVAVAVLLLLVAVASMYVPARRAAKTDPMLAMRAE
jgi:putative ABC transport system permease protein